MITAKPKLYYNTGLRVGHIPDYASKLDTWQINSREFDDHVGLQDFFLTSFRLKATWDEVKNADYMKYGDAYYWITPIMINENCAEIHCVLDAITSMGGPLALDYTETGTLTRAHPLSRVDMTNTLEEPIKPSGILKVTIHPISFTGSGTDDITLIASTVKLDDPNVSLSPTATRDALVFSGTSGSDTYTVCIPKAPEAADSTILGTLGESVNTVGYGLYDASNATVKTNLEYLRSLGLSDAVLFSYTIPKTAAAIGKGTNGHIISLMSGTSGETYSPWNSAAAITVGSSVGTYTVRMYKTFFTDRTITIRGRLSGDIKQFKAYELISLSDTNPQSTISFVYAVDPQYQGTTYCAPAYWYGNTDSLSRLAQAAKGLPWKETPISIGGATGSQWAWNQRATQLTETGTLGINSMDDLAALGVQGVSRNLEGLGGSALQLYDIIRGKEPRNISVADDPIKYRQSKANAAYAQALVQAPQLTTSPAFGLQVYLDNTFDIIELSPNENDIQRIDSYYQHYGYAQPNIVFDKSYMSSMPSWNYIEGHGITIAPTSAANFGISIKEAAEAQLNGGCTIWHVKPSQNAINY